MKYIEKHPYVFLGLCALVLFLAANSFLAITDSAESNYALTAKEMVLSGDWLSPQIYGHYWYDKPIFITGNWHFPSPCSALPNLPHGFLRH